MENYWSEYWSQGYLTSFGQDIKKNYTGKLKQSWIGFASELSPQCKILDIGTGNGALIQLIHDSSKDQLNFIGIDKATVAKSVTGVPDSSILSDVSAETLPFENNEFDAIVAQFAIEYSELSKSISELFRVLKPGGLYQIVCHEIDSDIVKPNMLILESAVRVRSDLLTPLKQLIDELKKDDNAQVNSLIKTINNLIQLERQVHPHAVNGTRYPDFFQFILNNKKIDLERAYQLFTQELEGLIFRLSDLKQAALNSQDISQLLLLGDKTFQEALVDSNNEYIGTLYKGRK